MKQLYEDLRNMEVFIMIYDLGNLRRKAWFLMGIDTRGRHMD